MARLLESRSTLIQDQSNRGFIFTEKGPFHCYCFVEFMMEPVYEQGFFLRQIRTKTTGKSERRFDLASVIIKFNVRI